MRIAFVCPTYEYYGGVETNVRETSWRLVKKGFDVEVLTTDPLGNLPKEEIIDDVRIKRFRSWAPDSAYYFSGELKKYLIENAKNYDVVHAHNYHGIPCLYTAQTKCRNKLIFNPHYHGKSGSLARSLFLIFYKYIAKQIFDRADRIVCVSNSEKNLVIRDFAIDVKKLVVIPNGVNLHELCNLDKKKKGYKVILYIGRLEKYKGIDYLIKTLRKLDRAVYLAVVGKGACKKSLIDLSDKLGVADRVKFYQDLTREGLLQKYAEADVFVSLSQYEAFGISVAEALATGTPCIVANTSALREWIDNRNCFGATYPVNIDELAKLIDKVIDMRVEKLKIPTWDEITDKLAKLYNESSIYETFAHLS